MAVLAAYTKFGNENMNLEDFLDQYVFVNPNSSTLSPEPQGVEGYETFINNYKAGLPVEEAAIKYI